MNCNPTLTADEFKTVHNALCELRSVHHSLQAVVREPILDKFSAAIRDMEAGLKGAYEQDNQAFETKHDYYREYQEMYKLRAIWSIYELDPAEGFNSVDPYKGAEYIVYDNHWGESEIVVKIEGPTWGDLYRAADKAISKSGDSHHCFIESFTPVADRPGHLRLGTGS